MAVGCGVSGLSDKRDATEPLKICRESKAHPADHINLDIAQRRVYIAAALKTQNKLAGPPDHFLASSAIHSFNL
jgi:hypothetical protein